MVASPATMMVATRAITVDRVTIPAVTPIATASRVKAAGTIPRVSKPGELIGWAGKSTNGAAARSISPPTTETASTTDTPAVATLVAHQRIRPTDWVRT